MQRNTVIILRVIAAVAVITSIIAFAPVKAFYVYLMPLSDNVQTELDRAVSAGLVGVIAIIDQPEPLPDSAYASGWHNLQASVPARKDAQFKIGSISKLYIAAAVTRLVAQDRLALENTLLTCLPELASQITHADKITLRMLVQHRSGIPSFTDDSAFPWLAPFDEHEDTQKSLALINSKPASFAPGENYEYSNTNYLLLARIIEKAVGYNYQKYIDEQFLTPLGLTQTFASVKHADTDRLMSGYLDGHTDDVKHLAFMNPAGAMVATAEDVAQFIRALNNGTLLNEEEQELYFTLYFNSHDGWLPGYLSFARYFKDSDTVIVLFTNTSGDEPWMIADFTLSRIHEIIGKK
ncbi:serine hydrolase domain-containing protein [Alteromonas sp. H39]|uniref:serine hydrolase domain-containing protein n=1 Tax=Alteromonas sp. H39 TaxID=3389876 RepID=UPI0039E1E175